MKKIIFIISVVCFLFLGEYVFAAQEVQGCGEGCRQIGIKDNKPLCSCCTKIDEGKYDCLCQGSNPNNDCRVGGLVTDPICACCGDCTLTNAVGVGITIANIILKYLGVIALLLFVYGGIIWMTSGGASEKIQQGKKIVLGAVIGIIIVCFAYVIVQVLIKALKIEKEYLPEQMQSEIHLEIVQKQLVNPIDKLF